MASATQKSCSGLGSKAKTTKTKPRAMMLNKRKLVDILNLNLDEKYIYIEDKSQRKLYYLFLDMEVIDNQSIYRH